MITLLGVGGKHLRPLVSEPASGMSQNISSWCWTEWDEPLVVQWNWQQRILLLACITATMPTFFWICCESTYLPDFVWLLHALAVLWIPIAACWQIQTLVYKRCSNPVLQLLCAG